MDYAILALQMIVLGVSVGVVSAALGVGGGIFMVPAFLQVFSGMDINTAKGSSLLIIMIVAAMNASRMNRGATKNPWNVVIAIASGSIVGGYLGAWITTLMSDALVTWLFIVLIAIVSVRMFFIEPKTVLENEVRRRTALAVAIGLFAGVIAGATGTGGGAVLVPLVLLAGIVSNERVVGLSNTVMAATCLAGVVAHMRGEQTVDLPLTIGLVAVSLAPLVVLGSLVGAPLGRWVNTHLSLNRRRIVMGVLLAVIAIRLVLRAT